MNGKAPLDDGALSSNAGAQPQLVVIAPAY